MCAPLSLKQKSRQTNIQTSNEWLAEKYVSIKQRDGVNGSERLTPGKWLNHTDHGYLKRLFLRKHCVPI